MLAPSLNLYSFAMYVKLLIFATLLAYTYGFCFNQPGGIGEYSKECMQSIGR